MPHDMKTLLLKSLLVFLVGCASTNTPPSPEVIRAADQFQAVTRSMSRDDVYRLLGHPQNVTTDGREQWSVSDGRDVATLSLRFRLNGKIVEVEKHYPMEYGIIQRRGCGVIFFWVASAIPPAANLPPSFRSE